MLRDNCKDILCLSLCIFLSLSLPLFQLLYVFWFHLHTSRSPIPSMESFHRYSMLISVSENANDFHYIIFNANKPIQQSFEMREVVVDNNSIIFFFFFSFNSQTFVRQQQRWQSLWWFCLDFQLIFPVKFVANQMTNAIHDDSYLLSLNTLWSAQSKWMNEWHQLSEQFLFISNDELWFNTRNLCHILREMFVLCHPIQRQIYFLQWNIIKTTIKMEMCKADKLELNKELIEFRRRNSLVWEQME